MKKNKIIAVIIAAAVICTAIWLLIPKKTEITFEGLSLTVPFKVVETSEDGSKVLYTDKHVNPNFHQDFTSLYIKSQDLSDEEYQKAKDWYRTNAGQPPYRTYGEKETKDYELFYAYTDSGPVTFAAYLQKKDTGKIWYLVSGNISHEKLVKMLETISFK